MSEEAFLLVDLKGRLSNPSARQNVRLATDALDTDASPRPLNDRTAVRDVRLAEIRSAVDEDELVRRFLAGTTLNALVDQYAISLSSVKRLLRRHGARRRTAQ
jgi:hypothetical protein